MIKNKFLSKDYNEELADIIEKKGFSEEAENLLLNMMYKINDSYDNYKMVRREVPSKAEFIEKIIDDVKNNCSQIEIAVPGSNLEQELQKNKCNILTKNRLMSSHKITILNFCKYKMLIMWITLLITHFFINITDRLTLNIL